MSHWSSRALVSSRGGGMLFLLDSDGRVFASQRETSSCRCCRRLPFGLKSVVDSIIAQSRHLFAAGLADFIIDLPLTVRIFSLKHNSRPTIALYIEQAYRRSD